MATHTENPGDGTAAASPDDATCSTWMAEQFAGAGGMSAIADAMASCRSMFATGCGPRASAQTEEAPAGTKPDASLGKEA